MRKLPPAGLLLAEELSRASLALTMALDLSKLGRKSYVSQAGIADILKQVRDAGGLPSGISKSAVKRSRQIAISKDTPFGPILKQWSLLDTKGREVKVDFIDPAAYLWYALQTCPMFNEFFGKKARELGSKTIEKWSIVLYSDEVTPGNQLKANNTRRLQTFYWTLLEFGPEALASEDAWMVLTSVRSKTVMDLDGKLSQLTKHCMLQFIQHGRDFRHGVMMPCEGNAGFMLCAQIKIVLADESALKSMYEFKGASGKLLCFFCRNTIQKRYAPEGMDDRMVWHTCTDTERFIPHSRESLMEVVDFLARQATRLNKGEFAELQTNLGINHCEHGVLSCREVMDVFDACKGTMFDWMHVYFVAGLYHLELNLLLDELRKAGLKQEALHEAFQQFRWPGYIHEKGSGVQNVFEKRKSADIDFKSSASEALGSYPVVRLLLNDFRQRLGRDHRVQPHISCFMLLCQVLDLLQRTARGQVEAAQLGQAIKRHLDAYQAAYPDSSFLPKAHFGLHLEAQYKYHKCLISCWVHERRHKEIKRYANQQSNLRAGMERHLLQEVALTHLEALQRIRFENVTELVNPKVPTSQVLASICEHLQLPTEAGVWVSTSATVAKWPALKIGDVVLTQSGVGEILYHVQYLHHILTCVTFYDKAPEANRFRILRDNIAYVSTDSILGPCIVRIHEPFCTVVPQDFAMRKA